MDDSALVAEKLCMRVAVSSLSPSGLLISLLRSAHTLDTRGGAHAEGSSGLFLVARNKRSQRGNYKYLSSSPLPLSLGE